MPPNRNWEKTMSSTRIGKSNPYVTWLYAGAVGGYVFGTLDGLLEGMSFHQSVGIGGHTLLAGAGAGLLGYSVYQFTRPLGRFQKIVSFGVAGSFLYGVSSLLVDLPPDTSLIVSIKPWVGFLSGFVGGAVAGLIFVSRGRSQDNGVSD